jgi:comEA protein
MFNLSRREKLVVVFLSLSALLGVGINYYRKIHYQVNLRIIPSGLTTSTINIDKLIIKEKLVNINKATSQELMRLPGIGKTLAERIVEYRRSYGPFKRIEDITRVSGIGVDKFNRMKEFLAVQ